MAKSRGITLTELMIALVIAGIMLSAGLITMRGYLPKQRLVASAARIENLLQRAQSDAMTSSRWVCIVTSTPSNSVVTMTAYRQKDDPVQPTPDNDNDCDTTGANYDRRFGTDLKRDITFPSCSGDNHKAGCVIWFDPTGTPKKCQGSGSCPGAPSGSICTDADFQLVITNPNLEAGARAREVEALAGGLIQTPKPGEKGLGTSFWAMGVTADTASGCE